MLNRLFFVIKLHLLRFFCLVLSLIMFHVIDLAATTLYTGFYPYYYGYKNATWLWPGNQLKEEDNHMLYRKWPKPFVGSLNKQWMFIRPMPKKEEDRLSSSVKYQAKESIVFDAKEKKLSLQGEAILDYDTIKLEANKITLDLNAHTIAAEGEKDNHNQAVSNPTLHYKELKKDKYGKESNQSKAWVFFMDKMHYNIHTKRALIYKLVTKQEDSIVKSEEVKKEDDKETFYARDLNFTTCALEAPHFYIHSNRTKMIQDKQVTSGPFSFYFDDVPTPIGSVFGTLFLEGKRKYGLICPKMEENSEYGFGMNEGGGYVNFNDYASLLIKGSIYSNGARELSNKFDYNKRYAFEGGINYVYNRRAREAGHKIAWDHKTKGGGNRKKGTLNANIEYRTSEYKTLNQDQADKERLRSSRDESKGSLVYTIPKILGCKTTTEAHYNLNRNSDFLDITLPKITVTTPTWKPFKDLTIGTLSNAKWLNDINMTYTTIFLNKVKNNDEDPNKTGKLHNPWNFYVISKMSHTVDCKMDTKLFDHINFSPFICFEEEWYWQKLRFEEGEKEKYIQERGLNRFYNHRGGGILSTFLYHNGTFPHQSSFLQGYQIRVEPIVTFTYTPMYTHNKLYFQEVAGKKECLLPIIGMSSPEDRQKSELKFQLKTDMNVKTKAATDPNKPDKKVRSNKIKLFEFEIKTMYDFHKKEKPLDNINLNINGKSPTIGQMFDLGVNGALEFDPYLAIEPLSDQNQDQQTNNTYIYAWDNGKQLGTLQKASGTINMKIHAPRYKDAMKNESILSILDSSKASVAQQETKDYDKPWHVGLEFYIGYTNKNWYDLNKRKYSLYPHFNDNDMTRTKWGKEMYIKFDGGFALIKKWIIDVEMKYDFKTKKMDKDVTKISLARDLHCWELSYSLRPLKHKYTFDLGIKAPILKVIKLPTRDRNFSK